MARISKENGYFLALGIFKDAEQVFRDEGNLETALLHFYAYFGN